VKFIFTTDVSHGEYHNELVSEADVSPGVLLKKISDSVLTLALLALILALLFPGFYQRLFHRHCDRRAAFPRWYLFSPPL